MKRIIAELLTIITVLFSCGCSNNKAILDNDTVDADKTAEVKVIQVKAQFGDPKSFNAVYGFCDQMVMARVKSVGESYILGGELDTTGDEASIAQQMIGIRTPYEIEIVNVYKGDAMAGDTMTVVSAHGTLEGYSVDFGLPIPEVGKTYIMPLSCVYGTDEWSICATAMAEVGLDVTASTASIVDTTVEIIPLMFESVYEGIHSVADIDAAVTAITNTMTE
ncbi:MAG: hypothetical protein IJ493_11820 [Clostridia bacterium]|nr:hypothetical protein [Clostridia bacterium]